MQKCLQLVYTLGLSLILVFEPIPTAARRNNPIAFGVCMMEEALAPSVNAARLPFNPRSRIRVSNCSPSAKARRALRAAQLPGTVSKDGVDPNSPADRWAKRFFVRLAQDVITPFAQVYSMNVDDPTPVLNLDFSKRVQKSFTGKQITRLGDLLRLNRTNLLGLPWIGAKRLLELEIRVRLWKYQLPSNPSQDGLIEVVLADAQSLWMEGLQEEAQDLLTTLRETLVTASETQKTPLLAQQWSAYYAPDAYAKAFFPRISIVDLPHYMAETNKLLDKITSSSNPLALGSAA